MSISWKQHVHQIARSFRDRWIHRPFRKFCCKEEVKDDLSGGSSGKKMSASQSSARESNSQVYRVLINSTQVDGGQDEGCLASTVSNLIASVPTSRKRKSRWDQNEWIRRDGSTVFRDKLKTLHSTPSEALRQTRADEVASNSAYKVNGGDSIGTAEGLNMDGDIPPGFTAAPRQDRALSSATPINDKAGSQNANWTPDPSKVVQGHLLKKFISRSPISYSTPVSSLKPEVASQNGTMENREVSPSLPFHPFPPLPMYPLPDDISTWFFVCFCNYGCT